MTCRIKGLPTVSVEYFVKCWNATIVTGRVSLAVFHVLMSKQSESVARTRLTIDSRLFSDREQTVPSGSFVF